MHVLKNVQIGVKAKLLISYKRGTEKLVPHVTRGALQNLVGILTLRGDDTGSKNMTVRLVGGSDKFILALVVDIEASNCYIKRISCGSLIKGGKQRWLVKIICVKEDDILTSGSYNSLVSGN